MPKNKADKAGISPAGNGQPRILLIDIEPALMERLHKQTGASFVIARYTALDPELISQVLPDVILAPLLGPGFDILDVAERLADFGYQGMLQAVTASLPDPEAVMREVSSQCEGIEFSLVVIDSPAPN